MTASRYSVQTALDDRPISRNQWGVIALCFLVALLDGFDTQSIAFIGPAIAEDFGLEATDMTWVITASTVGMALGAMTLGTFGDRIGRRKAIIAAILLFGVFSLLGSVATSLPQIVLLRFLIGLGMGGATPSLLALVAEYSPKRRRGLVMTLVTLGLPGGAMIGGIVAAAWLDLVGWRGVFLLGGALPLVLALVCLRYLPESPSLLVTRNTPAAHAKARRLMEAATCERVPESAVLVAETNDVERGSVRALFSREYRVATIAVWATYLFNWIAWFLLLLWLPTALRMLGMPTDDAALGTVTVNAAFIAFAIPLSMALPKADIRRLLIGMFAVGVLISLGLGLSGSNWVLVFALIAAAGFGIGGQQLALNYLIANTYPTQLRATATGWSIGIGRTGSIIGSALGGVLLSGLGASGYFMALAIPLVVAAFAVPFVRTARRGATPAPPVGALPVAVAKEA